ncbi:MAG: hypothetical protein ACR2G3_12735 [Solirubrobacterales bacterium]
MLIGIVILVLTVVLVGAQLFVAELGERKIEERLTEGGGEAAVTLSATPAVRLLFGDGDRIEVRGSALDLDLETEDPEVLDRLDGFEEVDVALEDFRAGPFDVASFGMSREGDGPYSVRSASSTTAADLVDYGADALGLAGGPLLRFFAGRAPLGTRQIPIDVEMEMESDDGRIRVVSGTGTVAGYPTGPLAQFITAAIVARL